MFQDKELQDKVKSLNDAREFSDPETASISGLSHVPCQPLSIPSPRGLTSRDSCLQPATRNSLAQQDTFLKIYLLQMDHHQHSLEISRVWHQLLADLVTTGKIAERASVFERDPQNHAMLTPRFARKF